MTDNDEKDAMKWRGYDVTEEEMKAIRKFEGLDYDEAYLLGGEFYTGAEMLELLEQQLRLAQGESQ